MARELCGVCGGVRRRELWEQQRRACPPVPRAWEGHFLSQSAFLLWEFLFPILENPPRSLRGAVPTWGLQEEGVDSGASEISGFPPQGPLVEGHVWGEAGGVEAHFEQRSALL